MVEGRVLLQALGTANVFSASTVDQMPKQVSAGLMFGAADRPGPGPRPHRLPPDPRRQPVRVERQPHDGARTSPDACARLRARGGRLVVVDPRRSKTAEEADEHLFIRPGTDAHFLFASRAHDRRRRTGPARPRGRSRRGARSGLAARPRLRARGRRPCAASTRRRSGASPAISRTRARRGLRAHRHVHPGVRHARVVARRRREHPRRQPRPRGRRDVHAARDRWREHRWHDRSRSRRALRSPAEPRPRSARVLRRAAGRRARGRDRDAR